MEVVKMDQEHERAAKTRGYQLWQESGSTHGHDREDWSRAEGEIEAAEEASQRIVVRRGKEERRIDIVFPWTPAALFFTMARVWIESGGALASMAVWLGPRNYDGSVASLASDDSDRTA